MRGNEVWHIVRGSQGDAVVSEAQFDHDRPRYSRGGDSIYFERVAYVAPRVHAARAARLGAKRLGGGDVCRVHLATRDVQCLGESDAAHEYSVEPSPSRDEVAFVRQASGRSELVLARGLGDWGLGEGARAIVQLPDAEVTSLEWSPDGERLAFTIGSEVDATITVVDRRGRVALEIAGHGPVWAPPGP
jgi:hypothetical protein